MYRFYLIEPMENADLDSIADRLASLKHVEEVSITDGSYGMVVRACLKQGIGFAKVTDSIKSTVGNRFGVLDAYYRYRKQN